MSLFPGRKVLSCVALAGALALTLTPRIGYAEPAEQSSHNSNNAALAELTDAIDTPEIEWRPCGGDQECATVVLPRDYRQPEGEVVEIALRKSPATAPGQRIGSLLVNPGGPGVSGTNFVGTIADDASPELMARFDIVGFDPRGVGESSDLRCFDNPEEHDQIKTDLTSGFPMNRREAVKYRRSSDRLAARCSGDEFAAQVSTTDVAMDLDMLRRALGEEQLNYLGWSYGSYLGQVYAAIYPDRIRTLAIDGVLDAEDWRGSPDTANIPIGMRLGAAKGAELALQEILARCAKAGESCPLGPDPEGSFAEVADALRRQPVTVVDSDGTELQLTYARFVENLYYAMYDPEGAQAVPLIIAEIRRLVEESETGTQASLTTGEGAAALAAAEATSDELLNDIGLTAAVLCSDSANPDSGSRWLELVETADAQAATFGRLSLWNSAVCARWSALDTDAVTEFTVQTSAPILVIGNYYDPATPYAAAVAVAERMPGARLLSSDSWGHLAYGSSACATSAIDDYLIAGELPAPETVCTGDVQPFG